MNDNNIMEAPKGMIIDKPEKQQEFSAPVVDPNLPQIIYPHYTNNAHTELKCVLRYPDGRCEEAKVKKGEGPLSNDIYKFFSEKELNDNTKKEGARIAAEKKEIERINLEQDRKRKQKAIWDTKADLLDIDIIKNTKHRALKRGIRKARTSVEALAYGAAIMIKETEQND